MRFRMNFGIVKTILIAVVILGALAIVGVDISMIAGVKGFVVTSPAIAWVSLCAAVLIALCAFLILFNSKYAFKSDKLIVTLGMFTDKIPYEDVVCVKQNSQSKELYLITKGLKPTDGEMSFKLNLSTQKTDDFIHALRQNKGDIVIDVFTPEKKDKDKK